MFRGRDDLGIPFPATFSFGLLDSGDDAKLKNFTLSSLTGRTTKGASIEWSKDFEAEGSTEDQTWTIKPEDIKLNERDKAAPFGSHPFGSLPFAGASGEDYSDVKRFVLMDKLPAPPYFEFSPSFRVTGQNTAFELLSYGVDEKVSAMKPTANFIKRQ